MGPVLSKIKKNNGTEIHSFNDVDIPKDYSMIKIATYNVNLKNSINLKFRIRRILDFINSSYKDKQIDILCLQGIHDYQSLETLIKNIKKKFWAKELYTAPIYDDIFDIAPTTSYQLTPSNIITNSLRSTNISKNTTAKKIEIQNLIVSRFPIVSTTFNNLDTAGRIDDVIGIKAIIGANINIYGNLVSIYSTQLSKDIHIANLSNTKLRRKEEQILFSLIKENKLNNETYEGLNLTDIHLINGTFNINYFDGNNMSEEFYNFITDYNCVDIYKYINPKKDGITNTEKERMDYTFLKLTDDVFSTPKWNKMFKKIKNDSELFNFIFKRYGIYFIDTYVRDDVNITNSTANFPVETVFIIKNYE